MTKSQKKSRRFSLNGVLLGLAVVAVGVLWMLSALGLVLLAPLWLYWPSILIVVGLCNLLQRGEGLGHYIFAVSLTAFGAAAQLHTLGWISLSWGYIWPGLLVAAGLWILLAALFHRPKRRTCCVKGQPELPEDIVVFGGRDVRISDTDWTGGEMTTIFGTCKMDLRQADIAGDEAELETTAIFGGVELRVPDHWAVEIKGSPILGAFEDKTRTPRVEPGQPRKTLVLSGAAVFGGVEVTN